MPQDKPPPGRDFIPLAIAVLTDSTYREEFLDELTGEMRETFRARADYLRLRAESSRL